MRRPFIFLPFIVALSVALIQLLVFVHFSFANTLTDEAALLFDKSKHSVFQVRVVDLATNEKSVVGSGFYISPEGHMATNYHVVSSYIQKPDDYRIEYIKLDGSSDDLKLIYIDVVHDLAILTSSIKAENFLSLGQSEMPKGERIFSMGNPHDFGMTIVEGTFSGLMEKSQYRKILFSGSLNPGMSGGPALNHSGEVIGINVSTMGNDVSFLVPVEFLKKLYDIVKAETFIPIEKWYPIIEEQLLVNQDEFIENLIASEWEHLTLGELLVPGEIATPIKCWGKSTDTEKSLVSKVRSSCSNEDYIYLFDNINTSYYSFWFLLHKSKGINTFHLYNHLESDFENAFSFNRLEHLEGESFTKMKCQSDFVQIADKSWKVALCTRKYKKLKRLYDIELILSTVDEFDQGYMGEMSAQGVSQKRALDLVKKFMEEIQWQK